MNLKQPIYNWYAIYTKNNGEKKIYQNLMEAKIECYLPLYKKLRQWSDRKKWIDVPFFRNYLFVRVSKVEFFDVLNIPGIVNYVSFGGQPQKIPAEQISNIKRLIEQQERKVILSKENIEKGQYAEIISGPFKDMKGEVVKICGNYRIIVRVDALGCSVYANILKEEIKIISAENTVSQGKIHEYFL